MASDEDLMAAIADGSDAAFRELLRRYERPLGGFLRKQVGDTDAEDLFQDVWLRVARGAARFDRARRFKPWLYRIALNEVRDCWTRSRAERHEALGASEVSDPRSTPAADRVDVERLLATLPSEQREVLMLRYQLDLSEAEIAEVLGVPRGTVKSRAHAALVKMSERVRRDEVR